MQSWTLATQPIGGLWVTILYNDRTETFVRLRTSGTIEAANEYHRAVAAVLQQADDT